MSFKKYSQHNIMGCTVTEVVFLFCLLFISNELVYNISALSFGKDKLHAFNPWINLSNNLEFFIKHDQKVIFCVLCFIGHCSSKRPNCLFALG